MSRGSTGRSKSDPLGFTSVECVAAQNRLVKRVVLLLRFVVCMGLFWILEQPTSSILQDHPTFQRNAKRLGKKQAFLWMRCFGAATPKGTQLWGNAPWLKKTQRKLRKSELLGDETLKVVKYTKKADGSKSVSGDSGLKATQSYPPLFGAAICSYHKAFLDKNVGSLASDTELSSSTSTNSSSDDSCIADILSDSEFMKGLSSTSLVPK